jgi:hypothetical protein
MNGRLDEPGVNKTGGRFRLHFAAARSARRGKTRTLDLTVDAERIADAEKFGVALNKLVWEVEIPQSPRTRAAAASFGIARDHHGAMVLLLKHTFHSSAFALLRCLFEAYLRGVWLRHCATDAQVEAHFSGEDPPRTMIADIEATPAFASGALSRAKRANWDAMCQYTHTGGLHLKQWQTEKLIEPSFDAAELENGLTMAEKYAALASLELAQMRVNGDGGMAVLRLIQERWTSEV